MRRRIFSCGQGVPIPDGWDHIDYISFDKAQEDYIDTGIIPDKNTKVEVVAMGMHNDYSHDRFFGVDGVFSLGFQPNGFVFFYDKNEIGKDSPLAAVNQINYVKFVKEGVHNHVTILRPSKGDIYVDIPDNTPSNIDIVTTKTMWVGRCNDAKGWPVHSNRIQYVKIWKSEELVGHFIPCHKGEIDALYNVVTGLIHYKNIDQGVFIQDIDSTLYTNEEYIALASKPEVNGIAIFGEHSIFVMSPYQYGLYESNMMHLQDQDVGLIKYSNIEQAKTHYDGLGNTIKINNSNYPYQFSKEMLFKNGKEAYIGSLGEWCDAVKYKDIIDEVITTISGTPFYAPNKIEAANLTSTAIDSNVGSCGCYFMDWKTKSPSIETITHIGSCAGCIRTFCHL